LLDQKDKWLIDRQPLIFLSLKPFFFKNLVIKIDDFFLINCRFSLTKALYRHTVIAIHIINILVLIINYNHCFTINDQLMSYRVISGFPHI